MKWIVFLLIAGAAAWAYFNVDFTNFKTNSINTFKQEKTIKKFFDADQQNKDQLQETLNNF